MLSKRLVLSVETVEGRSRQDRQEIEAQEE